VIENTIAIREVLVYFSLFRDISREIVGQSAGNFPSRHQASPNDMKGASAVYFRSSDHHGFSSLHAYKHKLYALKKRQDVFQFHPYS